MQIPTVTSAVQSSSLCASSYPGAVACLLAPDQSSDKWNTGKICWDTVTLKLSVESCNLQANKPTCNPCASASSISNSWIKTFAYNNITIPHITLISGARDQFQSAFVIQSGPKWVNPHQVQWAHLGPAWIMTWTGMDFRGQFYTYHSGQWFSNQMFL